MANGLVHDIHTLIAFGLPYSHVHRKKDEPARRFPGLRHRRFRHGWYQVFGRIWNFEEPFPSALKDRIERAQLLRSDVQAEELTVSIAHDYLDKHWDFDGQSKEERASSRKYSEGFYVGLLLNPEVLKNWAGVDVRTGRIHRVIEGLDIWEEEPTLKEEYRELCKRARRQLRFDKELRRVIEGLAGVPLSHLLANLALQQPWLDA